MSHSRAYHIFHFLRSWLIKKAIINVKNQDHECLRWALRSALFPAKNNLNNPYSYPKQDKLNMETIDFPTPMSIAIIVG